MGTTHQAHERDIVERWDDVHALDALQHAVDGLGHVRIEMDGVDDEEVRKAQDELTDGAADALEIRSPRLPAMRRHHEEPTAVESQVH